MKSVLIGYTNLKVCDVIHVLITNKYFCGVKASTLVVAEHDGGVLKGSSISAIAAASALGEGSTVSVLVGGTGPDLQQAASHASKLHPAIDKVQN